jgi:hypothetical protein
MEDYFTEITTLEDDPSSSASSTLLAWHLETFWLMAVMYLGIAVLLGVVLFALLFRRKK